MYKNKTFMISLTIEFSFNIQYSVFILYQLIKQIFSNFYLFIIYL